MVYSEVPAESFEDRCILIANISLQIHMFSITGILSGKNESFGALKNVTKSQNLHSENSHWDDLIQSPSLTDEEI